MFVTLGAFLVMVHLPWASVSGLVGLGLTLMSPVTWFTASPAVAFSLAFLLMIWLLLNSIQVHRDDSISPLIAESVGILRSSEVGVPGMENIIQRLCKLHGLVDI